MPVTSTPRAWARSRPISGRTRLVVLESWESPEALRDHVAAPHMKTYSQKTKDLIAKRTIHVLSAID